MCGVPDQNSGSGWDSVPSWNNSTLTSSSSSLPGGQPNNNTAAQSFCWSCYFDTDTLIPGADDLLADPMSSDDDHDDDDEDIEEDHDFLRYENNINDSTNDEAVQAPTADDARAMMSPLLPLAATDDDDEEEEEGVEGVALFELLYRRYREADDSSNDYSPGSASHGAVHGNDGVVEARTEGYDNGGDGDDDDALTLPVLLPLFFIAVGVEAAQLEGEGVADMNLDFVGVDDVGLQRTLPASKESVERLDKVKVEVPGSVCTVCMEDLQVGSEAKRMPCMHAYHGGCIDQWLMINNTCPTCRYQMPVDPH
ncbi:hypothetical protein Tsubulata_015487 [Turnera subulata]|uniref:RING-type E3 ubiquitin transferase n=1 Tax=Turnera subulata TaxID=218843 RepID=A0A9Q0FPY0_9ROSI|nr:hypothetical protein Tsubulata_015487 [Turnera subulata]